MRSPKKKGSIFSKELFSNKIQNKNKRESEYGLRYEEEEMRLMSSREQVFYRFQNICDLHKNNKSKLKLENMKSLVNMCSTITSLKDYSPNMKSNASDQNSKSNRHSFFRTRVKPKVRSDNNVENFRLWLEKQKFEEIKAEKSISAIYLVLAISLVILQCIVNVLA